MRDRLPVILNPAAGSGRAAGAWTRAASVLEGAGLGWRLHATSRPGDAEAMAAEAAAAARPIVLVVGGDGTVHEAANGLVRGSADREPTGDTVPTALAWIPAGNGNDFAKPLGLPGDDPAAAARTALRGRVRAVDIGRVNGRCFVNGVGMGLDVLVAVEARRDGPLTGTAMYGLALLRALRGFETATVRLSGGDLVGTYPITMLNVTNGPCHGGGFWICPHARIDDGLLDVCVADAMGALRVVGLALRVLRRAHVGHRAVSFALARRIVIESDVPLPVHADGEVLGRAIDRLEIDVLPGRLRVVAPTAIPTDRLKETRTPVSLREGEDGRSKPHDSLPRSVCPSRSRISSGEESTLGVRAQVAGRTMRPPLWMQSVVT